MLLVETLYVYGFITTIFGYLGYETRDYFKRKNSKDNKELIYHDPYIGKKDYSKNVHKGVATLRLYRDNDDSDSSYKLGLIEIFKDGSFNVLNEIVSVSLGERILGYRESSTGHKVAYIIQYPDDRRRLYIYSYITKSLTSLGYAGDLSWSDFYHNIDTKSKVSTSVIDDHRFGSKWLYGKNRLQIFKDRMVTGAIVGYKEEVYSLDEYLEHYK